MRELGELEYNTAATWDGPDEDVPAARAKQQPSNVRSTATVLGLLALGGVVMLTMGDPGGAGGGAPESSDRRPNWFVQQADGLLAHMPKSTPRVELRQDFLTEGIRSWQGLGAGWSVDNGLMRPGGLRIWRESRELADYRFQFEGRIENQSINWAVRAGDAKNYYASKLMVSGRGASKATEIVRYSMILGKETRRIRLPLPITLEDKAFYGFEIRANNDRFMTIVGGKVVDTWRDPRLRTGGVGFFSEGGERASIRWAKVTVGEDFVEKLRGFLTFGLIIIPVE